jgi:sporulation protein YlmC with PRC-barrel domain
MDCGNQSVAAASGAERDGARALSVDADSDAGLIGTSCLVGSAVRNHEGDDLGEVAEVMLDASSGQVSYAVLSFGGVLGVGTKLFAVPWSALTFDAEGGFIVLQVKKECLKRTPGFDKNKWPSAPDETAWWKNIQFYYR